MKDFYKQEIEKVAMEKIATRAWKKFLPKLSDKNYNRLLESGVYNPKKELSGFERGTQAILSKNNATLVRKPNRVAAAQIETARDFNAYLQNNPNFKLSKATVKRIKAGAQTEGAHSISRSMMPSLKGSDEPLKALKGNKTGYIYAPKNEHNKMIYNAEAENPGSGKKFYKEKFGVEPISRRDRENRRWTQAITERHEADEIRYSNQARKKGLLIDDMNGIDQSYFSHVSPKVLAQESANVGLMPRSIKNNQYKAMRSYYHKGGVQAQEANSIGSLTGTPYGSSAVYNKKGAAKAEKHWFNKGTYTKPINLKKEDL